MGWGVWVDPPVPIEVEIPDHATIASDLATEIETAVRSQLTFRCQVGLVPESKFGDSGYKTRLTVSRP